MVYCGKHVYGQYSCNVKSERAATLVANRSGKQVKEIVG